jgi:hypothetical protein
VDSSAVTASPRAAIASAWGDGVDDGRVSRGAWKPTGKIPVLSNRLRKTVRATKRFQAFITVAI